MRRFFSIVVLVMCLGLGTVLFSQPDSENLRVRVWLGEVSVGPHDSVAVIPVYMSNPYDTIAGIELNVIIDDNRNLFFALDDIKEDGLEHSVDTAGTMISGWEWIGVNSLKGEYHQMKVAGMADWPGGKSTLPLMPQDSGLLLKLVLRVESILAFDPTQTITVKLGGENTGLSDYKGNTIGVVTTMEKVCVKTVGDSCVSWKDKRIGRLDENIVRFESGFITINDSVPKTSE
ncbi:MAG: hypothetical protein KAR42_15750 [candidate division Zixibacteria bacterium]|nr:hypothetical protein [candidate division Zixibacteria bacterium]